jgi:hypothetical protein
MKTVAAATVTTNLRIMTPQGLTQFFNMSELPTPGGVVLFLNRGSTRSPTQKARLAMSLIVKGFGCRPRQEIAACIGGRRPKPFTTGDIRPVSLSTVKSDTDLQFEA